MLSAANKENVNSKKRKLGGNPQDGNRRHTGAYYSTKSPSPQPHKNRRVSFASEETQVKYFDNLKSPSSLAPKNKIQTIPQASPAQKKSILTASPGNKANGKPKTIPSIEKTPTKTPEDSYDFDAEDTTQSKPARLSSLQIAQLQELHQIVLEGENEMSILSDEMSFTRVGGNIFVPSTQDDDDFLSDEDEEANNMSMATMHTAKIRMPDAQEVQKKEDYELDDLMTEMEFTQVGGAIFVEDPNDKTLDRLIAEDMSQAEPKPEVFVPATQEEPSSQEEINVPSTQEDDEDQSMEFTRVQFNNIQVMQSGKKVEIAPIAQEFDEEDMEYTADISKQADDLAMEGIDDLDQEEKVEPVPEPVKPVENTRTAQPSRAIDLLDKIRRMSTAHHDISHTNMSMSNTSMISNATPKRVSEIKTNMLNNSLTLQNKLNSSLTLNGSMQQTPTVSRSITAFEKMDQSQRLDQSMDISILNEPLHDPLQQEANEQNEQDEEEMDMLVKDFFDLVGVRFVGDISTRRTMSIGGFGNNDDVKAPETTKEILRVMCVTGSEHKAMEELRQQVQQQIEKMKEQLAELEFEIEENNPPLFRKLRKLSDQNTTLTDMELSDIKKSLAELRTVCRYESKVIMYDMRIASEKKALTWITEHLDNIEHGDLRSINKYLSNINDLIEELEVDIQKKKDAREQKLRDNREKRDTKLRLEQEQRERLRQHKTLVRTPVKENCTVEENGLARVYEVLCRCMSNLYQVDNLGSHMISLSYKCHGTAFAKLAFHTEPTGQVTRAEFVPIQNRDVSRKLWDDDDTFARVQKVVLSKCIDSVQLYVSKNVTNVKQVAAAVQLVTTRVGRCMTLLDELERVATRFNRNMLVGTTPSQAHLSLDENGFVLPFALRFISHSSKTKFTVMLNLGPHYPSNQTDVPLLSGFQSFIGDITQEQISSIIEQEPCRFGRLTRLCEQFQALL
jgi:hypothetical protein